MPRSSRTPSWTKSPSDGARVCTPSPKRWLPYLDEPIEVELVDDAIWIRDGHHRFYTALLEGRKTVPVDLYIQDNPIRKIMAFAADPRSVALHPRPGTSTLRERLANAF